MKEGCGTCSRKEEAYCNSGDVISDHCCCDNKFRGKYLFYYHRYTFRPSEVLHFNEIF